MIIFRCFIFALLGLVMGDLQAKPFIPKHDGQVLERLPKQLFQTTVSKKVKLLRAQLKNNPKDWASANQLARQYIELSKTLADPRYMGYAQAIIEPWLQNAQYSIQPLILRAIIRQNAHDFSGAMKDLDQVLSIQPGHFQANLIKATVATVQGKYSLAMQHCKQLMRRSSLFMVLICQSTPASLSGNAKRSYQLLRRILSSGKLMTKKESSWAWTSLAEIAWRLGYFKAADQHFHRAKQVGVQDYYWMKTYADFLLQQQRPLDVIELIEADTQNDSLLLRLAIAEKLIDSEQLADHVAWLNERFQLNRRRGSSLHKGDEARFLLYFANQRQQALQLARQNWLIQREPTDIYILLKAAIAAHDDKTVVEVKQWLALNKTEDVVIQEILATKVGDSNEI